MSGQNSTAGCGHLSLAVVSRNKMFFPPRRWHVWGLIDVVGIHGIQKPLVLCNQVPFAISLHFLLSLSLLKHLAVSFSFNTPPSSWYIYRFMYPCGSCLYHTATPGQSRLSFALPKLSLAGRFMFPPPQENGLIPFCCEPRELPVFFYTYAQDSCVRDLRHESCANFSLPSLLLFVSRILLFFLLFYFFLFRIPKKCHWFHWWSY